MNFDMERLIKRTLFDNQAFYVDDISELAEESLADLCSDNLLENVLTITEKEMFSIDSRTDEYMRIMNASEEATNMETNEDDDSAINIDR